jgi:hypothetical protein
MTAWSLAEHAAGAGGPPGDEERYLETAEEYVDAMYAGRPHLRPVHDALERLGLELGGDVKICPAKTIVPFYRRHVFAQIKPATRTRIDMGFALGDTPATGRLIDTGGFAKKDRITHRIPVSTREDLDDEVRHWLRTAYQRDE